MIRMRVREREDAEKRAAAEDGSAAVSSEERGREE